MGKLALLSLEVIPTVSLTLLTRFQLASTALTVTLKAALAVCADGAPLFPVAVPGAAVSPGANTWSFAKSPALTAIAGLVLAPLVPSLISLAVTVALPAVFSVTLKLWLPDTKAAFGGKAALPSDEVIPTVCVTLLSKFQLASTALTVTVNAVPAVCGIGAPVLPVALPGAAASPGTRSWSLVNVPAPTEMAGLVFADLELSVRSLAVSVAVPALFSVTLNVLIPETKPALAGNEVLLSLEVIPTVSFTVVVTFQLSSTALTVTLKAVPAV